jgi:hypothetical protein
MGRLTTTTAGIAVGDRGGLLSITLLLLGHLLFLSLSSPVGGIFYVISGESAVFSRSQSIWSFRLSDKLRIVSGRTLIQALYYLSGIVQAMVE